MSGEARTCSRGCGALVYFDKNSPTGHPSPDKWIPLEMKGNLRTGMIHKCPKRNGSSGTLDSTNTNTNSKPELLETAQGLILLLQDYVRLKSKEVDALS
jgi:hypothetical protein